MVAGGAIAATAETKVSGSVGPGFSITLRDAQGNVVTRVEPGEFEIEVDDRSEEHNFHLVGPGGVDVSTAVPFVGKQTFRVNLVDGRYTFQCDPHVAQMRGTFTVGTGLEPTPPPPPVTPPPNAKPSAPVGARLALTVGPSATISPKTLAGKKITLPVRARVHLRRARPVGQPHRLRGAGAAKSTGVGFVDADVARGAANGTLVVQCDRTRRRWERLKVV